MCRISVSYDTAKRDIVKKNLEESGMSLQDAVRLYLDVLSNGEDVEDLKAYLIKKKVESDSEDTVCHFDIVEVGSSILPSPIKASCYCISN